MMNNPVRSGNFFRWLLAILVTLFFLTLQRNDSNAALTPAHPDGTVYNGNPANYLGLLNILAPGDTLMLEAGNYTDGLPVYDMNGTEAAPIIIQGPESGARAVFLADPCICYNTVEIQDSSYIEIYNLELDGQGLDGVDGVKAGGDLFTNWAHHITLQNLYIHDHDASQQTVGISTKIPAWDWVIRGNIIDSAGTGMYLGDSGGEAPFVNGLIEGNLVVDTIGYNVQIKHQKKIGRCRVCQHRERRPSATTFSARKIMRPRVVGNAVFAPTPLDTAVSANMTGQDYTAVYNLPKFVYLPAVQKP